MPQDDAEVIAASISAPERFAIVFDRHAPYIHRYLARRLGVDAADDLLADTFLAAFAKRHTFDRHHPDARPWLYGFASNVIRQHRRAEIRRLRVALATPSEAPDTNPDDAVLDRVAAHGVRHELGQALASLNESERDVLLLVAWEELSYEQMSAALGIPIGTVRSRLSRGRAKVRTALGGVDPTNSNYNDKELLGNG